MSDSDGVRESRSKRRFVLASPISAVFGAASVSILNLAEQGLMVENSEPLQVGKQARLSFTFPLSGHRIALLGRVVWSRLSRKVDSSGKFIYLTGLHIVDNENWSMDDLMRLAEKGAASPDDDSLERKRESLERKAQAKIPIRRQQADASNAEMLKLVQRARKRLQDDPQEARRWYNRAKFSIARLPKEKRYRDEILAVWEYLERRVDIEVVALAFELYR